MKFGKRLRRECHAEWVTYYLDYKDLKKTIKTIVATGGDTGTFLNALDTELEKLNDFFCGRVALFEEMFPFMAGRLEQGDAKIDSFMQWCEGLDHLRKYVVLNYIAVRKIVKKFDKNTSSITLVPPILARQPFYNSLSLARLITKTEILVAKHNGTNLADSFLCPVCLEILHAPVVLSCAHIFCWSCLARAAQFTCNNACPVCRKEMPLDPTAYKVDSLLQRFLSQNVPQETNKTGFGYFFQTPAPPRSLKVILAPARFATPQHATRFSSHCNARHTDAQICVVADNSPSYKQAVQLNAAKVLFVDTQVDPAALRKGETLVPFVEEETETVLGQVMIVGFRVGLQGSEKPVFKKASRDQSRPSLIFMKYLSFEQLEKTTFEDFVQKRAGNQKYLFILDSPRSQTGVWNAIPYTKIADSPSTLTSPIPYQEIFIKKGNNIAVHDRRLEDPTLIPPIPTPFTPSLSLGPDHPDFVDHPLTRTSSVRTSCVEDNVWSIVWRTYVLVVVLALLYYVFA